jgi:succinylglutamate desuccinylase
MELIKDSTMLDVIYTLPDGFLEVPAQELYRILSGPTLIHLPGRRQEPLFVSVLLHGNEDTGFRAVQKLLQEYHGREFPRALSIFVGNVAAARYKERLIDNQPDYNRIWPGGMPGDTPEHRMLQQVVDDMRERNIFASIDFHNNTGLNPHYACVNRLNHRFFHLATLFSRTVVYFIKPAGVQSMTFAELCPAVTVECGQVDQIHGVDHALDYLHACLQLSEIPSHPIPEHDIDLFHTVAIVKIPEDIKFDFCINVDAADICFAEDLDHLNFRELPEGTMLGIVRDDTNVYLDTRDEHDNDVGYKYFRIFENELQTARPLMPSMLTVNSQIIRQDCLCYLMERITTDYTPDDSTD